MKVRGGVGGRRWETSGKEVSRRRSKVIIEADGKMYHIINHRYRS